jgi:single-stranded-DNA-specific exonuclease
MFYVLLALRRVCRDELLWPADRIPQLADLLPIVALGTVADMVRLDANNRRLVAQGLERLRRGNSFAGLNALFQVANLNVRDASASNFGFAIGPRLNAAGRLGDMGIGIRCLIEDDPDRALDLAQQLDAMNHERREIEQEARDEALSQALSLLESQSKTDRKSLVLHDSRWHPGVIGLVAGRLKEQFYRPAIVFADDTDPGRIKGSCRSIPGVHIRDILERIDTQYPGLILTFGGHAMAAGLALESARLDEFSTLFESTLADFAGPEQFLQQLDTDGPLDAQYLKLEFAQRLAAQVWGQGFAPPVFMNRFEVIAQRRLKERHLKLTVRLAQGSPKLEAIWFNAERDLDTQATLAYQLSINDWQGRSSLQLEVVAVA